MPRRATASRRSPNGGGESPSYDDWTVSELKKRAKELGLTNYSAKKKSELITALRNH